MAGRKAPSLRAPDGPRNDKNGPEARPPPLSAAGGPGSGQAFGSAGFRGGHELTFDALDDYRIPIAGGHLLRVKKRHGQLMLERRRAWRDVSSPSGTGGLTVAGLARHTGQTADAIRRQLRQMAAKELVV